MSLCTHVCLSHPTGLFLIEALLLALEPAALDLDGPIVLFLDDHGDEGGLRRGYQLVRDGQSRGVLLVAGVEARLVGDWHRHLLDDLVVEEEHTFSLSKLSLGGGEAVTVPAAQDATHEVGRQLGVVVGLHW